MAYANNDIAKAYEHILKPMHDMGVSDEVKQAVINNAISLLSSAPRWTLVHNYGGAGHSTADEEVIRLQEFKQRHGL